MEVKTYKDESGYYTYNIRKDNKLFRILFAGNLDLYWTFRDYNDKDDYSYGDFVIKKEDGLLYSLLEDAYESIKLADPFDYCAEMRYNPVGDVTAVMYDFSKYDMYKNLFDGEKITWISDDRDLENDSLVQISKKDGSFILEFAKKKKEDDEHYMADFSGKNITVRFRNSGSYYNPFNCVFMKMYNSLGGYSSDFGEMPARNFGEVPGQIHIEDHVLSLRK